MEGIPSQLGARKAKVSLSGASKTQASTSKDILDAAKQDREARRIARDQPKQALKIQRSWRGYSTRKRLQDLWQEEWVSKYASIVANPNSTASGVEFITSILPLGLLALYPPPCCGMNKGSYRYALEVQGISLRLDTLSSKHAAAALRGLLALILRSVSSTQPSLNILLCLDSDDNDDNDDITRSRTIQLTSQLKRIVYLCCGAIGAPNIDSLTQAAAARIITILCNPTCLWSPAVLRQQVVTTPTFRRSLALSAAIQRLIISSSSQNGSSPNNTTKGMVSNLVLSQIRLWQQVHQKPTTQVHQELSLYVDTEDPALGNLTLHILTIPKLLSEYANQTLLQELGSLYTFVAVTHCTHTALAEAAASDGGGSSISTEQALYLLANLATCISFSSTNNTSSLRQSPEALQSFSRATQRLLNIVVAVSSSGKSFTESKHAASIAISCFVNGQFASQLLSALSLPAFCSLYTSLLVTADTLPSRDSLRVLSALAFGTGLLPLLWKQLALDIGLPLEVPLEASRWHVPSLAQGGKSLTAQQAQHMSLFCRVYTQYLAVIDDIEFHETQSMFSLSQQRAIAAVLNTLVFNTHIPLPLVDGTNTPTTIQQTEKVVVLMKQAPILLRAMFERDARRRYCSPGLWVHPYVQLTATSGQGYDVSGAAVLRALLQRQDTTSTSTNGLAEVLMQAPHCIPFEERVAVFRGLIAMDKEARRLHLPPIEGGPRPIRITIRRTHIVEDALSQLYNNTTSNLRGPLSVTFINAQGLEEAGIDMGGLTKELLETVSTALFNPDLGIFTSGSSDTGAELHPHPLALVQPSGAELLSLAGLILGRSLYDGVLSNTPLAPFFIAALQGRLPTLDDVASLDPEVHRSLVSLKQYTGDASELGLDFTVETDVFGARITEELIPGGADISVTSSNKLTYVHLMADWTLRKRVQPAAAAFSRGLSKIISPAWLRVFSPSEVNQLLGGGRGASIDVSDMKRHVQYAGGYTSFSRTIGLFWKVVGSMSAEDKNKLLKFCTSTSRPPLGGFKHLSPPLTIYKVDCGGSMLGSIFSSSDVDRLPSASTCSNTLKLPNYKKESVLRAKLLFAIHQGAGFELS